MSALPQVADAQEIWGWPHEDPQLAPEMEPGGTFSSYADSESSM